MKKQAKVAAHEARAAFWRKNPHLLAKRRRRRMWVALLLLALVLMLLRRCGCGGAPIEVVGSANPAPQVKPKQPRLVAARAIDLRQDKIPRELYQAPQAVEHAWLAAFYQQFGARGPRLAACFSGKAPGALRWTGYVNPDTGIVSEQEIEGVGASDLGAAQVLCVKQTLARPRFQVGADEAQKTPVRVSLVIEF